MKIQLLTFPGCPNAGPAKLALRDALAAENVPAEVEEIDITRRAAPPWVRGWGSPTILVNGGDVAGAAPTSGEACCRLYEGGTPTVAQIRSALARAHTPAAAVSKSRLPLFGGIAAALAASACCLVPAVLAVAGVSAAGLASSLAPLRPYFLGIAAIALAAGFWLAYRPSPQTDDCGCANPVRRRRSRIGLWSGAALIVGIASYPLIFDSSATIDERARGVAETRLHVTGMDCKGCTKTLATRLARVPGIATVEVDYEHELAIVTHDGTRDRSKELIEAVEEVGYSATVEP